MSARIRPSAAKSTRNAKAKRRLQKGEIREERPSKECERVNEETDEES
jgi:hypothetical protein